MLLLSLLLLLLFQLLLLLLLFLLLQLLLLPLTGLRKVKGRRSLVFSLSRSLSSPCSAFMGRNKGVMEGGGRRGSSGKTKRCRSQI